MAKDVVLVFGEQSLSVTVSGATAKYLARAARDGFGILDHKPLILTTMDDDGLPVLIKNLAVARTQVEKHGFVYIHLAKDDSPHDWQVAGLLRALVNNEMWLRSDMIDDEKSGLSVVDAETFGHFCTKREDVAKLQVHRLMGQGAKAPVEPDSVS